VAGFVMLPKHGSGTSLVMLGCLSFASGLVLLAASGLSRRARVSSALVASAVFAAAIWWSPDPFPASAQIVRLRSCTTFNGVSRVFDMPTGVAFTMTSNASFLRSGRLMVRR
jgi:hypothetical protein